MQERRAKRRLNSRATRRKSVRSDIFRWVWKAGHVMNSCALRRWPSFITNDAVLNEGTTFSARVAKHLSSVLLLNLNFFRPRKFVSIAHNPFHSPWINICVLLRSFGPWTLVLCCTHRTCLLSLICMPFNGRERWPRRKNDIRKINEPHASWRNRDSNFLPTIFVGRIINFGITMQCLLSLVKLFNIIIYDSRVNSSNSPTIK